MSRYVPLCLAFMIAGWLACPAEARAVAGRRVKVRDRS